MDMNSIYSPSKFLNKINNRNRYYLAGNDQPDESLTISKKKSTEEKNKINNLANRLRTLLKLPKAHRWVIYEWFYSNLDQPLFCYNRQNDFQLCLNDIFPQLKTRNLRRAEWCQIRKLMGKPRRCSSAFLEEERETLKRKREKLREIYLNSSIDNLSDYQDLPDTISLPLIIGSKCTVLYKKTHDGLFNGTINAIDLKNGTYRVSFDKTGFNCENVYDFEVRSVEPVESMPLVAFESKKNRPVSNSNSNCNVKKLYNQQKITEMIDEQSNQQKLNYIKEENNFEAINSAADLSSEINSMVSVNSDESFVRFMNHCSLSSNNSTISNNSQNNSLINSQLNTPSLNNLVVNDQTDQLTNDEKMIGSYPFKFLSYIISFYKLINKKTAKLNELKSMNTQAEFYKSSAKYKLSNEFRNEYATIILELEKIKDNINLNLEHLDRCIKELKLNPIKQIKNGYQTEDDFVRRNLMDKQLDQNSKNLITNLIGILLTLKNSSINSDDLSNLQPRIKTIKKNLHNINSHCFENNVELHFNHLQFNYLDKMTNNSRLDAFHNDHL